MRITLTKTLLAIVTLATLMPSRSLAWGGAVSSNGNVHALYVHGPRIKRIRPKKAHTAHIGPMPWQ